jgi:hypothetical protein
MRHPVASRSFVCHHRIGIQSGHSFKFDLAFRQPLVPAVFSHKIRKFERAYRIGFADVLPDFSTNILCVQVSNTKTFSHLTRGRRGGQHQWGSTPRHRSLGRSFCRSVVFVRRSLPGKIPPYPPSPNAERTPIGEPNTHKEITRKYENVFVFAHIKTHPIPTCATHPESAGSCHA